MAGASSNRPSAAVTAGKSFSGRVAGWRRELNGLTARYPAVLLLAGIFAAVIPLLSGTGGGLFLLVLLLGLGLAWWTGRGAGVWRFGLAAAAGTASVVWVWWLPSDHYRRVTEGDYCGAEIRFVVADESCGGEQVPWLESPGWIFGQITELRFSAQDVWRKVSGELAVQLPDGTSPPGYGDILQLRGAFTPPPSGQTELVIGTGNRAVSRTVGVFDFATFLQARGVSQIFRAREAQRTGYRPSLTATLLQFRNVLLCRTGDHIASLADRNLLSGLIFGCRQCLDSKSRYDYIRTGTIHIFTVGGFHVGILAFMALWLFRWVPFTPRYLLIPVLMTAYVATTGFTPPTVRTLIMFGIWSVCRGLLMRTPALNIIFLSAAVILLLNPFYLFDLGFQYSFTVVAFLVASGRPIVIWVSGIEEKINWLPAAAITARQRWAATWKRGLAAAVAGGLVAWLASTGITMYYQGLLFPAGPGLNLLIIPFVWLIFLVAGVKMVLPPLPGVDVLLGRVLEALTSGMSGLCEICSRWLETFYLRPPSGGMVLLFCLMLLALLFAKKRWLFVTAGMALLALPVWWELSSRVQPAAVSFLTGGDGPAAVLLSDPAREYRAVINVPAEAPRFLGALLKERGSSELDLVLLTDSTRDFGAGLATLGLGTSIRELALDRPRANSVVIRALADLYYDGSRIVWLPTAATDAVAVYRTRLLQIWRQNSGCRLEYGVNGFTITAAYRQLETGETRLEAVRCGQPWAVTCDHRARLEIRTVSTP